MASLRALRSASAALRTAVPARTFSQRALPVVIASRSAAIPASRFFSLSARRLGQGETDVELLSKLQQEIKYEADEANSAPDAPESVSEFMSQGVWKVEHQAGHDEVTLSRTFGNENIRVVFSIGDIDTAQESMSVDEDSTEDSDAAPVFSLRCSITITKPTEGALSVDAIAQEGSFIIENVSYYGDSKLATELTAEADWRRRGLYLGPQFDHLDVNVQEAFEAYLDERGIGASLAAFIPDFAEWKEQQEYTKWLSNVHAFIKA